MGNDPSNRGRWCAVGLWLGIWIVSTSVASGVQWIGVLSPVFTASTLLFLSGIPLLEQKSDARHGQKEEYINYKKSTSPLIPLPTSLYSVLPMFLKCFCLCEFTLYNKIENKDSENAPIR